MALSSSTHVPVLTSEVLEWARPSLVRTIVDGTLGGGGHAATFLAEMEKRATSLFIGIDRDPCAVAVTSKELQEKFSIVHDPLRCRFFDASYAELPELMDEHKLPLADSILLDIGLSSDQLASPDRGFSFRSQGELDLRFNPNEGISAADYLAKVGEKELADTIYRFGEERFSRRIARAIIEQRRKNPIRTADQLHALIHRAVPGHIHGRVDASTRTFQALRIAVNRELEHLERGLAKLPECLAPGGRLLIISFHSLEDRLVKNAFRNHPLLNRLTKKPIVPSEMECDRNPRARSAKLRVAERRSEPVSAHDMIME